MLRASALHWRVLSTHNMTKYNFNFSDTAIDDGAISNVHTIHTVLFNALHNHERKEEKKKKRRRRNVKMAIKSVKWN